MAYLSVKNLMALLVIISVLFAYPLSSCIAMPVKSELRANSTLSIIVNASGEGDHTHIQLAIDRAGEGDTILVEPGTYFEQVIIDKSVNLIGAGCENTLIDGEGEINVITITADRVNVTGFSITNSSIDWSWQDDLNNGAIFVDNVNSCTISNNTIAGNCFGVRMEDAECNSILDNIFQCNEEYGVFLFNSKYNHIANNTYRKNRGGIKLEKSKFNVLIDNNLSDNLYGIYLSSSSDSCIISHNMGSSIGLSSSSNVIIRNNSLNNHGIGITGDLLEHWNTHTIDETNVVNGKPVRYYKNATGGKVPSPVGGVILANTTEMIIENLTFANSSDGLLLGFSSNNMIRKNVFSSNRITLRSSCQNSIIDNNLTNNGGISLYSRSNKNFIENNICGSYNENASTGYGIYLDHSNSNSLFNNTCSNKHDGIKIYFSNSNQLSNNICNFNSGIGIRFKYCNFNHISGNTCNFNQYAGIYLSSESDSNIITTNTCNSNLIYGINLFNSDENYLGKNTINSNGVYGLVLMYVSNAILDSNTLVSNERYGISLISSDTVTLFDNRMVGSGISIEGSYVKEKDSHTIDTSNTVNNKPIYYLKNISGGTVPINAGQVILISCSNVTVEKLDVSNGSIGIELVFSSGIKIMDNACDSNSYGGIVLYESNENLIFNNSCNSNDHGIILRESINNTVSKNILVHNEKNGIKIEHSLQNRIIGNAMIKNHVGICLDDSRENHVYGNSILKSETVGIYIKYRSTSNFIYGNDFFFNNMNTSQALDNYTNNSWYLDKVGNYWSDWPGPDLDADGIVDVPYPINGTAMVYDHFPSTQPFNPTISTEQNGRNIIAEQDSTVHLIACDFYDLDNILNCSWIFYYNGTLIELWGINTNFTFQENGDYTITLIVLDSKGDVLADRFEVTVTLPEDNDDPNGDGNIIDRYGITYLLAGTAIILTILISVIYRKKKKKDEDEV